MPSISIIIVNWNTRALLQRCLESILAYPPTEKFEILVVDNASGDDSKGMLHQHFSTVRVIANQKNLGFARANNQAAYQARGRYLLLLNPDTLVRPTALPALVAYLDTHLNVGAVGPRILNPDGSLQVSAHPFPTLLREAWRMLHLDRLLPLSQYPLALWQSAEPQPVDVLMGACILLRRELVQANTLFDEQFFIYSEEVDLCRRIRQAGWELHWLPSAVITHYGAQSTRQVADQMFLELYRNKVKYFRKHHGRWGVFWYKLLLFFHALVRSLAAWSPRSLGYRRLLAALLRF